MMVIVTLMNMAAAAYMRVTCQALPQAPVWQPSKTVIISTTSQMGTLKLRAETNKKQTNKKTYCSLHPIKHCFLFPATFGKSSLLHHGFQSLNPKCTGKHNMMVEG